MSHSTLYEYVCWFSTLCQFEIFRQGLVITFMFACAGSPALPKQGARHI